MGITALNLVLEAVPIEFSQSLHCSARIQLLFMCFFFLFLAACVHSDEEFHFFACFFPQFTLTQSLSLGEVPLQQHEAGWSG